MLYTACTELYPSDINFIFSPASMGVDSTSWVTQFISHTISNEELDSGFRVSFRVDSTLVSLHLYR